MSTSCSIRQIHKPTNVQLVLRLTRSQHMALLDVLLEAARDPAKTQVFVNCAEDVTITISDLLIVTMHALREIEVIQ